MTAKIFIMIVIFVINIKFCQSKSYERYPLYSVIPTETVHLKFLQNVDSQKYIDMKFWKKPYKLYEEVHFIVNPKDKDLFIERAAHFRMSYKQVLPDIQEAFSNQTIHRYLRFKEDSYTWDSYHTLQDIYQWLADIVAKFPARTTLSSIGKSAEGRDIYVVTIRNDDKAEQVIVEGGIHGNEWVSIEFVTYLIHHLLHIRESHDRILNNVGTKYNWYLLPVVNPDGFEYTHKEDRLWSKNRRSDVLKNISGVDLDRNFDYSFGNYSVSHNPNDDDYCGPEPFSEPESKVLSQFVMSVQNLKFYFAFHNYGQRIIIPYGDRINHVENYGEMENYGKQAILRMFKLTGVKYRVGTMYDTLGARISGNSASWVKRNKGVRYVFTFHVRDNGAYGLALPTNQILNTCRETMAGILEVMTARPKRVKLDLLNLSTTMKVEFPVLLFTFFVFCIHVIYYFI